MPSDLDVAFDVHDLKDVRVVRREQQREVVRLKVDDLPRHEAVRVDRAQREGLALDDDRWRAAEEEAAAGGGGAVDLLPGVEDPSDGVGIGGGERRGERWRGDGCGAWGP